MCTTPKAVVVVVDDPTCARAAATFAAVEARSRDLPIRLVTVTDDAPQSPRLMDAARMARSAIASETKFVPVEELIRYGDLADVLVGESESASLVCIGTRHRTGMPLGPIAVALAQRAACDVAIVRADRGGRGEAEGVVSVVVDDGPTCDAVVHRAMHEGRMRHATVRLVDRRLSSWVRRFPDVSVELVAAGTGPPAHRVDDRKLPQLAVLDVADAARLAGAVTPNCHPIVGVPDCSMLFVHAGSDARPATTGPRQSGSVSP